MSLAPLWHPSPNFGPRRGGVQPDMIVIHYTAMASAEAALERLCDPVHEVSAHYLIAGDGRLWQMVRDEDRAWHAGAGAWGRVSDVNSHSIGIELDNTGRHPFSEPQMTVLEHLLRALCDRWSIPPVRVLGHGDVAPHRKSDPGRRFDWRRLARSGLAVWPEGTDFVGFCIDEALLEETATHLTDAGYACGTPEQKLDALRARFRPWKQGPVDDRDRELALRLSLMPELDAHDPWE